MGIRDLLEPVRCALADFSLGTGHAGVITFAPDGSDGDVHVKTAWRYFVVKVATWCAARTRVHGGPAGGYLAVHDAQTGAPVAILRDEHYLTDLRTAAAGAATISALARADSQRLGIRDSLAVQLPGAVVEAAQTAALAVADADIVVTAAASREPLVCGRWLVPGQHLVAVGADDPSKAELDAECFRRADIIAVDSRPQTPQLAGDLRAAIATGAAEVSELAEIRDIAGRAPGRRSGDQTTVAKLIGLGVQDLAAAEIVLRKVGISGAAR